MTVEELSERLSYDAYLQWRAFYNWEHWRRSTSESSARLHAKAQGVGGR